MGVLNTEYQFIQFYTGNLIELLVWQDSPCYKSILTHRCIENILNKKKRLISPIGISVEKEKTEMAGEMTWTK